MNLPFSRYYWCCCSATAAAVVVVVVVLIVAAITIPRNKFLNLFFPSLSDANKMTDNCRIKYDIRVRSPFFWWFAYVRPFRVWFKRKKSAWEKIQFYICEGQRVRERAAKFLSIIFQFQLNCQNRSEFPLQAIAFDSSFHFLLSLKRKMGFRVNPCKTSLIFMLACSLALVHTERSIVDTNCAELSMHVAFNIFIGYIRQWRRRRRRTQLDSESIGQAHTYRTLSHTCTRLHNLVDSVKQWHWSHKLI